MWGEPDQLEEMSEIVAPPMVAGKPRLRASPNAMIEPLPVATQYPLPLGVTSIRAAPL